MNSSGQAHTCTLPRPKKPMQHILGATWLPQTPIAGIWALNSPKQLDVSFNVETLRKESTTVTRKVSATTHPKAR